MQFIKLVHPSLASSFSARRSQRAFAWVAPFAFGAMVVGCSAQSPDDGSSSASPNSSTSDTGESEEAIVGGKPASEGAVVALELGGQALCTGTLVAPRVVLTARHCVSETAEAVSCSGRGGHRAQVGANRDPSSIVVLAGDRLPGKEVARGASIIVPSTSTLCAHDAAAIVLDHDVTGVTPLSVAQAAPTKGEKVRFVGYGRRGDNAGYGQKRARTVSIESVSAAEFEVGAVTCNGDSGGPALSSTHEIVGIVSRGGPTCQGKDVQNIATRADVFRSLVDRAIAAAEGHSTHAPPSHAPPPTPTPQP